LTVNGAVKIALLNNPSVKVTLAQLGISQADMIQAGLLHNPKLSGLVRKSNEEDSKTNTEFEVKADVMDLLFWPLRKRLASVQFKQAEYDLAKSILDFINEVRIEFYTWQASEHMLLMRQEHFKAEESALELVQRQKQTGNINELDLEQQKGVYYRAKTDLQRVELETNTTRQQLRNLLGLTNSDFQLLSQESLPDLPLDEFSLNDLEEKAITNRIDLAMKKQEIKAFEQSLTMARLGVIPSVEGGFNWEKEIDGSKLKGPAFEADVPIFDHKQADRLRAQSQIDSGKKQLEALEAQVRLEVRLAYDQLTSNKSMVEVYKDALPVRQEILKQTLYHYNYMLKGVYDLLRAKQEEIETERDYIMALRDYWIARTELEHAVGVALPVEKTKIKVKEKPAEPVKEHEHYQGGAR
jgi:cobalt-zinc-cadmium efflux system outer membrane protein